MAKLAKGVTTLTEEDAQKKGEAGLFARACDFVGLPDDVELWIEDKVAQLRVTGAEIVFVVADGRKFTVNLGEMEKAEVKAKAEALAMAVEAKEAEARAEGQARAEAAESKAGDGGSTSRA